MRKPDIVIAAAAAAAIGTGCVQKTEPTDVIFSSDQYTVYTDRVVQGGFTARAVSPLEIVTDYKSPEVSGVSSLVHFRFSLNSRDNELTPGLNHTALVGNPDSDGAVYSFGQVLDLEDRLAKEEKGGELPKDTEWTVRVDMRPVLASFKKDGYYVTGTGDTIYRDDFKGLWVAGGAEPLNWDFDNLYGKHDWKLSDRGDGIYTVTIKLNPTTDRASDPTGWKIERPDGRFPQYASGQVLVDALYNMAISDIASDIRPDDTYRAGAAWDGVWTRDVSYSIYLALAYLDPVRSMNSLRAKVKDGRIVQDTGTGGSWPVSSDRVVWAIGAWEIYKVTGDKEWLAEAHKVIAATLEDDMLMVWNPDRKMMRGEQTYLDWREQTYPKWMQPKDIYESMCLGTNVVFAEAFSIMARMEEELGLTGGREKYLEMARTLRSSINSNLWIPNLGYYSEYLYGGIYPIQSQATDNLGQSLGVLFDVASPEMAASIISKTPVNYYGTSSVFPQMPDIRPYHNDAVWPFVQAYWNLAAAKTGNMQAFSEGLAAIYRAAAMFGTDKELFVSSNGDYRGTAVNSDAQLWSAAGSAAMVFRAIAGMSFTPGGIDFAPFVPAALSGDKTITGFRYRDMVLSVTVKGTGSEIETFMVDGKVSTDNHLPGNLTGEHSVEIQLADNAIEQRPVNRIPQAWMPSVPVVTWNTPREAEIRNFGEGMSYGIYLNGVFEEQIQTRSYRLYDTDSYTVVGIVPVKEEEWSGFTMCPYEYIPQGSLTIVQAEDMAHGGTPLIADKAKASRFVEITREKNTKLPFSVDVPQEGTYFIDFRYANGSGPINTENKCALRTLTVNGRIAGPVVMPQRGIGEWLSTGMSNMLAVELEKGRNTLTLEYLTPQNVNMNGETNTALIDYMRVIRK